MDSGGAARDELEAAEALAGLARGKMCDQFQDPTTRTQQYSGDTPDMVTIPPSEKDLTLKAMPRQLCSSSYRSNSNSPRELPQNLKDAAKEAKKLRRILANRESARQTIRRREAMYLELTRKATDLLEENEILKKRKEDALNEYTSLKGRNEFLKTQMSELKGTKSLEMQEERESSRVEISSSATPGPPAYLFHQSSLFPVFLPHIFPSSDVFQSHIPSHPDLINSCGTILCSHQQQENSAGILRPLFVLPVPCLLPFLTHGSIFNSHCGTNNQTNITALPLPHGICPSSDNQLHEDKNHLSSKQNMMLETSDYARILSSTSGARFTRSRESCGHHPQNSVMGSESLGCSENSLVNCTSDVNLVCASDHIINSFSRKSHEPIACSSKKVEDAFAAVKARRKRKELMKLKNPHYHHIHAHH